MQTSGQYKTIKFKLAFARSNNLTGSRWEGDDAFERRIYVIDEAEFHARNKDPYTQICLMNAVSRNNENAIRWMITRLLKTVRDLNLSNLIVVNRPSLSNTCGWCLAITERSNYTGYSNFLSGILAECQRRRRRRTRKAKKGGTANA